MTNVSIQASIQQYKSDIFFTRDSIQSQKREPREFKSPERVELKSPEISDYPRQLFSPQISRKSDKLYSDIFNVSNANNASPKPAKTVKKVGTNIFLGDAEPEIVKKDKSKAGYDPNPYYTKTSAASRKLKELYGEETLKTHKLTAENFKRTTGTLARENLLNDTNRGKHNANPLLSAKQRKLLADQSSVEIKEAKGMTNQLNNAKTVNEKIPQSSLPQEKRLNDMRSNIFYDPNRGNIYEAFSPKRKQDVVKEEKEEKKVPPKVSKFSKNIWKPVEEWEEGSNQNSSNKNNEAKPVSSLGTKLKNLEGNINISEKNVNVIKKTDQVNITTRGVKKEDESIRNDLRSSMKENLKIDNAKLKKQVELSSANQGFEFFQKTTKPVKNSDLSFQTFEIKDVPNISEKIRDIELIFKKKGIHIFDLKANGNLLGQPSGEVSFKLRGSLNDGQLAKNVEDVNSKLQSELKLRAQPVQTNLGKRNMEAFPPSDCKWYSSHSNNFGDKTPFEKPVKRNEPSLYKTFGSYDTGYKNNYGSTSGIKLR